MKKIVCTVLALVLLLSAAACGKKTASPQEVVGTAMEALKSGDMAAAAARWGGEIGDIEDTAEDDAELFKMFFQNLKYEILAETDTGTSAVVQVAVSNADMAGVMGETIGELMQKAVSAALSGQEISEEEAEKMFTDTMKEKLSGSSLEMVENTVDIGLTLVDGQWQITDVSDEAMDALMGGMLSVANSMGD